MNDVPAIIPPSEPEDAYTLLSRPVLELSDKEVEVIVQDLRRRRALFVQSDGKKADNPGKAKAAAVKLSADDKKANTLNLLSQLKITL